MKTSKDCFKCVYDTGVVYGSLAVSIGSCLMAVLMVLIMLIEQIYNVYIVIFCCVFVFLAVVFLIISLCNMDKKFVIDVNECKIESRSTVLFSTKTQSIRRIVILVMPRGGKQYIVFDCDEYPFIIAQDFLYLKIFRIRYFHHRLKNIRKYCPNCKVDEETLYPW